MSAFRLTPARRLSFLTNRERAVLSCLVTGKTVDSIACELYVTEATVRSHIRGILSKLGVQTQLAAVALAYEAHWPDHLTPIELLIYPV